MKLKIISILLSLAILLPAHAAKQPGWDYFPENGQIDLTPTGTQWKIAHDQEVKGEYIMELIPNGQSINRWKELVMTAYTSYELLSKENPIKKYMQANLAQVEQVCKSNNGNLTTKVLKETATSIVYRFEMKGCGKGIAADETSIVKHMKGQYGFHTMKFSSKAPLNTAEREAQMIKVISNAHLTIMN